MKTITRPLLLFALLSITMLCVISLSGCGTPDGNPADGKRWYEMHNCSSCHGPNGNDGRAPNIANIDRTFGSFTSKLRTKGASIMPEYSKEKVSKQDVADIYLYLKSIKE